MEATKAETWQALRPIWPWGLILLLLPLAALAYVLLVMSKMRRASRKARDAAATASEHGTPLLTYDHAGRPGDPLNIQLLGSAGQIGAAFAAAGWYRADEIDLITSLRIIMDSLLKRRYSTAPVSNLYLYGRKEDLAFERPGPNVRQRDHIRLWSTGQRKDERPIWLGGATEDIKIELAKNNHLPTHGISPDLDAERNLVVTELTLTGYVIEETTQSGLGKETHSFNGGGDPYFTDGQVAVLTLADVRTPPLATQVRGPLGARLARFLASLTRARLPQVGLERAEREHGRLKQAMQSR